VNQTVLPLPCLEFEDAMVPFPERGQRVFLEEGGVAPTEEHNSVAGPGMWLARVESGLSCIVPSKTVVTCEARPVVGLVVLHHGQRLLFAGRVAQFLEVAQTVLTSPHYLIGRQCNYCRDHHSAGALVVCCALCGEAYCQDCWSELAGRRCCSRNCRFSPGSTDGI